MTVSLSIENIVINRKITKNILSAIPSPVVYSPSAYGVDNHCTGRDVKIAILDSGCPTHCDIKISGEKVSLCEEQSSINDRIGHSTIVSGIIAANNKKNIMGFSPSSKIFSVKVIDNNGICEFNTLVAGVLWAIVKQVDIIVIAMGSSYNYAVLHSAIKKAREHGICVFAASGDREVDANWEIDYPARYPEVFSTGFLTKSKKKNDIIKKKVDFFLSNESVYSTHLDNKYIKITGSSVSTAFFAGLGAVLIEQYKQENKKDIPDLVFSSLNKICK